MMPGLAVPFIPLTLAAGPAASYNVAAVAMPALAAWTAYLLCRHLTGRFWPSLAGGYLYGFSSYMLGQQLGHLQMTATFLLPLAALVILQYLKRAISGRGLVIRLGAILALQPLLATELEFTLTLAIACSLLIGLAVAPDFRRRIVSAIAPIALSYLVAAALCAPFIYYLLKAVHTEPFHQPQQYDSDVLNFVVPTSLTLVGHGWAARIAAHFPGNISEQGAYIGIPALLIVALYIWRERRTAGGRFLALAFLTVVLATIGFYFTVKGRELQEFPWAHIGYRGLFDNILPDRLSLYLALIVAVTVAAWAARTRGTFSWLLPVLAIAAIVPAVHLHRYDTAYTVPAFFTQAAYRPCLNPDETVLPLPPSTNGDANLWQTADQFRFNMAGGYVSAGPPPGYLTPPSVKTIALGNPVPRGQALALRTYIKAKGVTSVIVDRRQARSWQAALDTIAKPRMVGGVILYQLHNPKPGCPAH